MVWAWPSLPSFHSLFGRVLLLALATLLVSPPCIHAVSDTPTTTSSWLLAYDPAHHSGPTPSPSSLAPLPWDLDWSVDGCRSCVTLVQPQPGSLQLAIHSEETGVWTSFTKPLGCGNRVLASGDSMSVTTTVSASPPSSCVSNCAGCLTSTSAFLSLSDGVHAYSVVLATIYSGFEHFSSPSLASMSSPVHVLAVLTENTWVANACSVSPFSHYYPMDISGNVTLTLELSPGSGAKIVVNQQVLWSIPSSSLPAAGDASYVSFGGAHARFSSVLSYFNLASPVSIEELVCAPSGSTSCPGCFIDVQTAVQSVASPTLLSATTAIDHAATNVNLADLDPSVPNITGLVDREQHRLDVLQDHTRQLLDTRKALLSVVGNTSLNLNASIAFQTSAVAQAVGAATGELVEADLARSTANLFLQQQVLVEASHGQLDASAAVAVQLASAAFVTLQARNNVLASTVSTAIAEMNVDKSAATSSPGLVSCAHAGAAIVDAQASQAHAAVADAMQASTQELSGTLAFLQPMSHAKQAIVTDEPSRTNLLMALQQTSNFDAKLLARDSQTLSTHVASVAQLLQAENADLLTASIAASLVLAEGNALSWQSNFQPQSSLADLVSSLDDTETMVEVSLVKPAISQAAAAKHTMEWVMAAASTAFAVERQAQDLIQSNNDRVATLTTAITSDQQPGNFPGLELEIDLLHAEAQDTAGNISKFVNVYDSLTQTTLTAVHKEASLAIRARSQLSAANASLLLAQNEASQSASLDAETVLVVSAARTHFAEDSAVASTAASLTHAISSQVVALQQMLPGAVAEADTCSVLLVDMSSQVSSEQSLVRALSTAIYAQLTEIQRQEQRLAALDVVLTQVNGALNDLPASCFM